MYTVNLPSVTEVIRVFNPIPAWVDTTKAAAYGTEVHAQTALIDMGKGGDLFAITPETEQYLEFKKTTAPEVIMCEQKVVKLLTTIEFVSGYAGTVDRVYKIGDKLCLVDIKTGHTQSWHKLQLTAYAMALEDAGFAIDDMFCLYLSATGYRLKRYKRCDDDWLDMLKVFYAEYWQQNSVDILRED